MFHVLFRNGSPINKNSFAEAKAVMYSDYIIRSEAVSPPGAKYYSCKHEILDEEGNPKNLRIGDFELINISNDVAGWSYFYQELTFFDLKSQVPFTVNSNGGFAQNFFISVVGFLEKLNLLGSYVAYQNTLEIEQLKKDLESAKASLLTKDKEINELEQEINQLKEKLKKYESLDEK